MCANLASAATDMGRAKFVRTQATAVTTLCVPDSARPSWASRRTSGSLVSVTVPARGSGLCTVGFKAGHLAAQISKSRLAVTQRPAPRQGVLCSLSAPVNLLNRSGRGACRSMTKPITGLFLTRQPSLSPLAGSISSPTPQRRRHLAGSGKQFRQTGKCLVSRRRGICCDEAPPCIGRSVTPPRSESGRQQGGTQWTTTQWLAAFRHGADRVLYEPCPHQFPVRARAPGASVPFEPDTWPA